MGKRWAACCCLLWLANAQCITARQLPVATVAPASDDDVVVAATVAPVVVPKATNAPKATEAPVPETPAPTAAPALCLFKETPCLGTGKAKDFTGEIGVSSDISNGLLCCNADHKCVHDSYGAPRCLLPTDVLCDSGDITEAALGDASASLSWIPAPLPTFSSASLDDTPTTTSTIDDFPADRTAAVPKYVGFPTKNSQLSTLYDPYAYRLCAADTQTCVTKQFKIGGKTRGAAYCIENTDLAKGERNYCDFGYKKVLCTPGAAECVLDPHGEGHCLPPTVKMCTNGKTGHKGRYTVCDAEATCVVSEAGKPVCIKEGFQLCDGGGPEPTVCLATEECKFDNKKNGQCLPAGSSICEAEDGKGSTEVCTADQDCLFDSAGDANCLGPGEKLCDNGYAIGTASSNSTSFSDAQDGVLTCKPGEYCLIDIKENQPVCLSTSGASTACRDDDLTYECALGFECDGSGACVETADYGVGPSAIGNSISGAAAAGVSAAAMALAAVLGTMAVFCV